VFVPDWVGTEYEEPQPEDFEPEPEDFQTGYYREVKIAGKLKPPFPPLERELQKAVEPLGVLVKEMRASGVEPVAIFDGLDRLMDARKFGVVAVQDLRAIRQLGVSVIAAAPLSLLYGAGRLTTCSIGCAISPQRSRTRRCIRS